jgi:hypothetical protein
MGGPGGDMPTAVEPDEDEDDEFEPDTTEDEDPEYVPDETEDESDEEEGPGYVPGDGTCA